MKLSRKMFQFAFGCHHRELSRVFTLERQTYQVCLRCGQQVQYSWDLMQSTPTTISDCQDNRSNNSTNTEAALI
ncbi:MAG TPA: hypothetical protein VIH89_09565 [Candidatus Sulfotelmatobacter sp.]